jgi:hypothetical protein
MNKLKTFTIAALAAAASVLGYKSSQGAPVPPQITTSLCWSWEPPGSHMQCH